MLLPALLIGDAPLTVADVRAVARDDAPCRLSAAAAARIRAAYAAMVALLDTAAPIYGVTTGLGAAVDTSLAADPDRQRRIPLARAAGIGPRLPRETVRAAMLARLSRLATGYSGISLPMAETLAALLNRGVTPSSPPSARSAKPTSSPSPTSPRSSPAPATPTTAAPTSPPPKP